MIAIARRALRGPIEDRNGQWLARSDRDANGEATREYRDDTISHVVGYASRRYGTAGLERTYNAQLLGLQGVDPAGRSHSQVQRGDGPPPGPAPVARPAPAARGGARPGQGQGRGGDAGSGDGRDPGHGLHAGLRRLGHRRPRHRDGDLQAPPGRRRPAAAAARHARALRARVGVQDRDRDRRPQHRGDPSRHDVRGAAAGREEGARGGGVPGPGRAPRGDRRHGPGPHGCDRGQLQHLVRAGRARDRRRPAGQRSRKARVRGVDPVRPADGDQPRDVGRRTGPGRLHRRRRAGIGLLRAGGDIRDAPPDGARGVDRGQRRRADEAPRRDGAHRGRALAPAPSPRRPGAGS